MNEEITKFKDKNIDILNKLDDYIYQYRNNIQALIIAPELMSQLYGYDYDDNAMKIHKHNDIRIIIDPYSPPMAIRILLKDNPRFDLNMKCNCGIFPDERPKTEYKIK